ncbi:MAG TPA: CehA/McbA family metallohydrolase, partial [Pirellulales bacterium]
AAQAGLLKYFTPIVGNEVTTRVGHFNVFPLAAGGSIDPGGRNWSEVFAAIHQAPRAQVIVLNHADDLHSGFRPFGSARHIDLTGEDLDGWKLEANAMEVINSGALRNDPLELVRGWFGELNAGLALAPVGSSDCHVVSRFIVGQGRTYVRVPDDDPGRINVAAACESFRQGRVIASLGLLAEITVDEQSGPGDLVSAGKSVRVSVRVSGPSWTQARHVALYANGLLVREAYLGSAAGSSPGLKSKHEWVLDLAGQDVYLVAVAHGPGVREPFWPIAKPYQPSSPHWEPYVLGISGAVRIDADGRPGFTPAREYAQACWQRAQADLPRFVGLLGAYDQSVAEQGAGILRAAGHGPFEPAVHDALRNATPTVQRGFAAYRAAWRTSQAARSTPP